MVLFNDPKLTEASFASLQTTLTRRMIGGRSMLRHEVPKRIRNVRRLARHDLWEVVRFKIVDGRRMLRKWLADPTVSDELRVGDAAILARFEAHLAERVPRKIAILTSDEALAMLSAKGQTRH